MVCPELSCSEPLGLISVSLRQTRCVELQSVRIGAIGGQSPFGCGGTALGFFRTDSLGTRVSLRSVCTKLSQFPSPRSSMDLGLKCKVAQFLDTLSVQFLITPTNRERRVYTSKRRHTNHKSPVHNTLDGPIFFFPPVGSEIAVLNIGCKGSQSARWKFQCSTRDPRRGHHRPRQGAKRNVVIGRRKQREWW